MRWRRAVGVQCWVCSAAAGSPIFQKVANVANEKRIGGQSGGQKKNRLSL